jgi:hypothetical protein
MVPATAGKLWSVVRCDLRLLAGFVGGAVRTRNRFFGIRAPFARVSRWKTGRFCKVRYTTYPRFEVRSVFRGEYARF